jgi:hypothetical protein
VVVMEAPAATPQPNGIAEAAVGASAMVLSEAAATSPSINLRNIVDLLQ